ncbi:hypothetical protein D3C73_1148560 [compost metagenome]
MKFERVGNIVSHERLPVGPFHTIPKSEGDRLAILGCLPFGGEPWHRVSLGRVEDQEGFVDGLLNHRVYRGGERVEVLHERAHVLTRDGEERAGVRSGVGRACLGDIGRAAGEQHRAHCKACRRHPGSPEVSGLCHDGYLFPIFISKVKGWVRVALRR